MSKVDIHEEVKNYLIKNGITEMPETDKETLKLLRDIVYDSKVASDCLEMNYSNYRKWYDEKQEKTAEDIKLDQELKDKFIERFRNLEINTLNGSNYVLKMRDEIRNKRVEKIFGKRIANVKGLFKVMGK